MAKDFWSESDLVKHFFNWSSLAKMFSFKIIELNELAAIVEE
jgi:hypothetical protein